ncbi:hypothetical protein BS47DRAFT_1450672 [Hydnum rufescens UP504]|uniref:Uncharacterized protein n=1 Tax=Hydnum rufescens UP504 TaxID=1448309 RepID=A0A9P6DLL1_9AGAM|nr:hypothetical protein BS47DRAFT_1450672 [Hydnum rufescens UP504]
MGDGAQGGNGSLTGVTGEYMGARGEPGSREVGVGVGVRGQAGFAQKQGQKEQEGRNWRGRPGGRKGRNGGRNRGQEGQELRAGTGGQEPEGQTEEEQVQQRHVPLLKSFCFKPLSLLQCSDPGAAPDPQMGIC